MRRIFNSWSLRKKILIPLTVVSIALAAGIYFYFSSMYEQEKQEGLVREAKALVLAAESAREYTADQSAGQVFRTDLTSLNDILLTVPVMSAIKVAQKKAKELNLEFRVPKFSPRNPKNQPDAFETDVLHKLESGTVPEYWSVDPATNMIRFFRPVKLTKECMKCHGDPATSSALWNNNKGQDPSGATMEGWKEGEVHGAFEVLMSLAPVQADVAAASRTIALIALLGGGLTIAIGIFIANAVARPAKALAEAARDVAQGDLTITLESTSGDELGKLSASFNEMVASLRHTVTSIIEASTAVASASAEISSSTEQMAAGMHEQTSQTTEVAGAVDEMIKTIISNSKNATSTADTTKEAKHAAEEGGSIVEETVNGMKRIAEVVRQSAITVKELGKSSDQISEIITVIQDIADQTNLLALNAAIEAARAGEQGRGFAVVADEVRKLAERTTKATKEIAATISKIQTETHGAVASMDEGTKQVDEGITLADKAGASLHDIVRISQRVTDMVTQIAAASEEQSSASEEISRNVSGISAVTNETASGTQQIAQAAEDLHRLTDNLQQLVQRFKLTDEEQGYAKAHVHHSLGGKSVPRRALSHRG